MKKFLTGIALSSYPSYFFFTWIYVFNRFKGENQQTKFIRFKEQLFYSGIDITYLLLLCVALSLLSIYFFARGIKIDSIIIKVLAVTLTVYATVLTVFLIGYINVVFLVRLSEYYIFRQLKKHNYFPWCELGE
jgi:hypothetical protein